MDRNRLEEICIPDGVTEICGGSKGYGAFKDCESLEKIYIPASATKIATYSLGDSKQLRIITPASSYAESYAKRSKAKIPVENC